MSALPTPAPDNRVLVIGYVWPEPKSSAAGSHMLSLLKLFRQQGWQVTFASPAQRSEHMHDLAAEGITGCAIELNNSTFDDFVRQLKPAIVLFDRFMMEEQFGWRVAQHCPDALRILDTEDLQCLRSARHQAHKNNLQLQKNQLYTLIAESDLAKREIAAIFRSDLSLIISTFEMDLLQNNFGVGKHLLHHLPFMLDLSLLPSTTRSFEDRRHFIAIGNFRHAPNWDSVLYLQQIWPRIRKQLPRAELHIYGSYPPPKATALHNPKTGFMVKGWAKDALQVIGEARVLLAPLRFGAGIKGKLLDAMQVATPSVTTSIGAESMTRQPVWPGLIANTTDTFADNAVALYSDKFLWQQASNTASKTLHDVYNIEPLGQNLIERIRLLQQNLTEHRSDNFIGAMLNHHTLQSTRYMSQWIEAKNKRSNNNPSD